VNILLFYDCVYPESLGGVEHRNRELARALAARGHHVTLAGFASGPSRPFEGVEILPVGNRGRLYNPEGKRSTLSAARLAWGAARLDLTRFDVIETANIPYAHLWPLALRCRRLGKPLIVTWHEYWGRYWKQYLGWKWPLYAAFERATVRLGTRAIAVSRLTAERVQAHRKDEVKIIPNGIPYERIRASAAEGAATPGPPLIYAGRLLKEKRLDLLLGALQRLLASFPEPWTGPLLDIIGEGPDRERLEDLVRRLNLGGFVSFLGHLPSNVDVWRKLGGAKIAVQPSSREGFGLFPLEAMAAGLPVVYCESSESALTELVEPGVHGLCTAPEPEPLAQAIGRLLGGEGEGERARMAEAAREHASGFDWGAVAGRVEGVFAT
jgi:glycosyltransferase involved in cell wall biosynthesis